MIGNVFFEALVGKILILVADPAAVLNKNVSFRCVLGLGLLISRLICTVCSKLNKSTSASVCEERIWKSS